MTFINQDDRKQNGIIAFESIHAGVLKLSRFLFFQKLMQQELQYDKLNMELQSLNNVYEVGSISMIVLLLHPFDSLLSTLLLLMIQFQSSYDLSDNNGSTIASILQFLSLFS